MKKYLIIPAIIGLMLYACKDQKNEAAEAALDDLEILMEEAEDSTVEMTITTWEEIEVEYMKAKAKVDSSQDHLSETSKEEYMELQEDYNDLQMKYKAAIDNTEVEANKKMTEIEEWMESNAELTAEEFQEAQSDIEVQWEEFKLEFSSNLNQLSDGAKERWNALESKVENWLDYNLNNENK